MALTVSVKTARRCCKGCNSDFGHSPNGKAKDKLRRTVKRRDKQNLKRNFDN